MAPSVLPVRPVRMSPPEAHAATSWPAVRAPTVIPSGDCRAMSWLAAMVCGTDEPSSKITPPPPSPSATNTASDALPAVLVSPLAPASAAPRTVMLAPKALRSWPPETSLADPPKIPIGAIEKSWSPRPLVLATDTPRWVCPEVSEPLTVRASPARRTTSSPAAAEVMLTPEL